MYDELAAANGFRRKPLVRTSHARDKNRSESHERGQQQAGKKAASKRDSFFLHFAGGDAASHHPEKSEDSEHEPGSHRNKVQLCDHSRSPKT